VVSAPAVAVAVAAPASVSPELLLVCPELRADFFTGVEAD
jgi:hypothetical protein